MKTLAEVRDIFDKTGRIYVPERPREVLESLARVILPVMQHRGKLHYMKPQDIFGVAYTWSPKAGKEAKDLTPIGSPIMTFHSWAYYGCFKPTIAEVLSQIPSGELGITFAFEMVKMPETADDLNEYYDITMRDGYHVAKVQLYGKIAGEFIFPGNGEKGHTLASHKEFS